MASTNATTAEKSEGWNASIRIMTQPFQKPVLRPPIDLHGNAQHASPLTLPIGVFDLLARRDGADDHCKRRCERRNFERQGADRASTKHRCPPCVRAPLVCGLNCRIR